MDEHRIEALLGAGLLLVLMLPWNSEYTVIAGPHPLAPGTGPAIRPTGARPPADSTKTSKGTKQHVDPPKSRSDAERFRPIGN